MIDKDGSVLFDLYHGTSSIFLPLIEEYGLGGLNIHESFDLGSIFLRICEFLEQHESQSEWWQDNDFICESILKNKVSGGGMNFRYGDLYVTPSIESATRYATLNRYGSEYLSTLVNAHNAVKQLSIEMAEEILPSNSPISDLVSAKPLPILISTKSLNINSLSTERGNDIIEQLRLIEQWESVLWQQLNFKTTQVVPFAELKIEYI